VINALFTFESHRSILDRRRERHYVSDSDISTL